MLFAAPFFNTILTYVVTTTGVVNAINIMLAQDD